MKILSLVLIALVASMMFSLPAFADSKLDSLVNVAKQARTQLKAQLDKTNPSDNIKLLFERGSQETESLISAASRNDQAAAKQHFLAAMKTFKQINLELSESVQTDTAPKIAETQTLQASPQSPAPQTDYKNSLDRVEKYASMLRSLAAKNNLSLDFTKIDELVQSARTSLANDDMASVEKIFGEIKSALNEIQAAIKDQTLQKSNERAMTFKNKYVAQIDKILAQAKELRLTEDDIAKLNKAKEELATTGDPTQIILKIKRYQISSNLSEYKNQRILAEMSKMEAKLTSLESKIDDKVKPKYDEAKTLIDAMKAQTSDEQLRNLNQLDSMIKEIESYIQSQNVPSVLTESLAADTRPPTESKQERAEKQDRIKQREAKLQRLSAEIARLDAKLAALEPQIDDNTKPKFEKAQSLLSRLKSQTSAGTEAFKALRTIDSLIGEIVSYIESQDSDEDQDTGVSVDTKPVEPARPSDRDQ